MPQLREKATEKLADIEAKVASLTRMRKVLVELVEACPGDGPAHICPILAALDEAHDDSR